MYFRFLHRRELCDELRRHLGEVGQNLLGAFPHARLVVVDVVLLAEGLHEGVNLSENKM